MRKRCGESEQKVGVWERNREIAAETAEVKKKDSPRLTVGQDGVRFSSADTNFVLKLGAHVQADGRFFIGDHIPVNDTFLLRRVGAGFFGGGFLEFDHSFMLEFCGNNSTANRSEER